MNIFEEKEYLLKISKRVQLINRENEITVEKLIPVWQAIILGGMLKLVKNRIRYNALINFIKAKIREEDLSILAGELANKEEQILSIGESMIGILFPDKKSAIAIHVSQKLQCKSSLVLKGLAYFLGVYAIELKQNEGNINEFNKYGEYILGYKGQFNELIATDLQKILIDILLLNDVLKSDGLAIFADSFEEAEENDQSILAKLFTKKNVVIVAVLVVLVGITLFLRFIQERQTVSVEDTEEIIPIDSLNKLNDSLVQAVVDSTKLASDSTVELSWTNGKKFLVPKQSAVVQLHTFLSDSTITDPLEITCYEIIFAPETDQVSQAKDYFFKRFAEGFQANQDARLEIISFSEKDLKSAMKRGFLLKNRLVGEGISPKRISIRQSNLDYKPDPSIPLNSQVIFRITK